ncbi:Eco57I restriction-modification methylase domain-containing protein [Dyadobacter tibetensis]|uniref:Eco57I restriction-modification methylase domain-containing protein n=1 Tax=Dyadobacter tibetensis TaxID=1211851 RepID=UPI000472A9A1|nr:Eco57I restriction-modification methylase domain-containing protein [Dyadobacter tibetensis]
MVQTNYNPDVLSCLANLSNDEVFTPPSLVNDILDLLPSELWSNPGAKFLDPVSKSGVFLREMAKRLMDGLEAQITDKQERINHIFGQQLYGIAITDLTALLSRRSVYCSKTANGKYSICESFDNEQGNIRYESIKHTWQSGKCIYCGANKEVYSREDAMETHAYNFIHTDNPEKIFNMKFDVIVGNPPYQLNDGGHGASAKPIYHKFVEQAIKLRPRYISMIIPARWFAGGRVGELTEFREKMLRDKSLRIIHDFQDARDCFPGVEIKGGVNYFLWDRDNEGLCKVYTHSGNKIVSESERSLLEDGASTFIRYNEAIPILKKVQAKSEKSFSELISANDPFGFDVRVKGSMKRVKPQYKLKYFEGSVKFYYNGWRKDGVGYIDTKYVQKNPDWLNQNKLFVAKAIGTGDCKTDIIKPFLPDNPSCTSETYLVIGPFQSNKTIENILSYIGTKFFHFLVSLKKITQEARRGVYEFVPMQDFSEKWTDEKLYKKYKLTTEEIDFIESMIRPKDLSPNGVENE